MPLLRSHRSRTGAGIRASHACAARGRRSRRPVASPILQRRAALAAARIELTAGREKAGAREVPEQYLLEVERELVMLGSDLAWLDALIARLERHEFPWGAPALHSERYLQDRRAARL